jgi:cell division protein FtsQ
MNRRRTIERRFSLARLFGRPGHNRRLRKPARPAEAGAAPVSPREWGALGRRLGRAALTTLKCAVLAALLLGVGVGGYYGYRRVAASTYFTVKAIEVRGSRRAPREEIARSVESVRGRSIFTADLEAVARAARAHPWVREARVRRELPSRIVIEVSEHRAQALLLLGHLYLVADDGEVFKRAALDEVEGLPVITGVDRLAYLSDEAPARARILRALEVLRRYYDGAPRPALSEVQVGARDEVTLYLRNGGAAIRLGADPSAARLVQFDRVWAALGPDARRARVMFLDNEVRADRVTVRLGASE